MEFQQTSKKRPQNNSPGHSPPSTRNPKVPHTYRSPNSEATVQAAAALAAEADAIPPTPQEQSTIPRIIIKGAGNKNWHLRDINPQTKTLVIADSNGKAYQDVTNFPENTQILTISGLKIPNVYDLLSTLDRNTFQDVKTVVVAVGV